MNISTERKDELRKQVKWMLIFGKGDLLEKDSGIPFERLRQFMNTGEISDDDLTMLDVLADL